MRPVHILHEAFAVLGALSLLGAFLVLECSAFAISNEELDGRGDILHLVRAGHQE